MNEINNYNETTFESIKHIDNEGNEFWYARELMPLLEYSKWENFHKVIKNSMTACKISNNSVFNHFPEVRKPIAGGNGNIQNIADYKLSRYACYLIAQNGDSRKESVALVQTRKMELTEKEYSELTEDEKRFYQRSLTKSKKLRYKEDILDNMGSYELIVNLFRISQTEQKIKKDNIQGESNANNTHYEIGKNIREVIAKNGGTMPEDLPTPDKSLKELEKLNKEEQEELITERN